MHHHLLVRFRPRTARHAGSTAPGLLAAVALAGCSWFADPEEAPAVPCPRALLLQGAERMVSYEPGRERTGTTIRHIAGISALETACRAGAQGLEVDLRFVVAAEAGPAFAGGPIDLDLFVATVASSQVLERASLDLGLEIGAAGGRAARLEEVTIGLGNPPRAERIYLGFELDPESPSERLRQGGSEGGAPWPELLP